LQSQRHLQHVKIEYNLDTRTDAVTSGQRYKKAFAAYISSKLLCTLLNAIQAISAGA